MNEPPKQSKQSTAILAGTFEVFFFIIYGVDESHRHP
jgi:hypothetical protein